MGSVERGPVWRRGGGGDGGTFPFYCLLGWRGGHGCKAEKNVGCNWQGNRGEGSRRCVRRPATGNRWRVQGRPRGGARSVVQLTACGIEGDIASLSGRDD